MLFVCVHNAGRSQMAAALMSHMAGGHVQVRLWMADPMVPADFVGLRDYGGADGKTYEYRLYGQPDHPDGGEWEGRSVGGGLSRRTTTSKSTAWAWPPLSAICSCGRSAL